MKTTAQERAAKMMKTPSNELPKIALDYLNDRYKFLCGDVCITAFSHYAQIIEGLYCDDDSYKADNKAREWFKRNTK
jgi:hypothetical protein